MNQQIDALLLFVCTQDDKIASLENQVLEYKDELRRIRSQGSLTPEERDEQQREIEDYKSHSKLLKNQVKITVYLFIY